MEVLGLNLQDVEDDLQWSPPREALSFRDEDLPKSSSRWGLLLELFIQRQPDIICLQECPYDLEISLDAYLKGYSKGCSLFVRRHRNSLVYSKFECSKAYISAEVRSELLLSQCREDPSKKPFWVLNHRMESFLNSAERVQHLLNIQWLHGCEDRVVYIGTLRDNERRLMVDWGWHRDSQGVGCTVMVQVPQLEVWRNWFDRPRPECSEPVICPVVPQETPALASTSEGEFEIGRSARNPAGPSSSITTTLGVEFVESDTFVTRQVHMDVEPSPSHLELGSPRGEILSQWETSSEGLTADGSFPVSPKLASPRKKKARKGNRCLLL